MKKLYLTILYTIALIALTSYSLFAGYYVGTSASGSGNGSSWANKDLYTDNFWGSITAGDTIFFDGGTDSLIYSSQLTVGANGSWNNYIHLLPGKYSPSPSGHSGKVIFDHNYSGGGYGIQIHNGRHWIKIKGFIIRYTGDCGISIKSTAGNATNNPSHIWVDSCDIYEVNANECIELQGYGDNWDATELGLTDTTRYVHHIEISRCRMWTHANRSMPECNIIYGHLTGWLNIHHNFLWQRNMQEDQSGDTPHIDPIQLAYSHHSVRIYNNVMSTDSCVSGHVMIIGFMSRSSDYADTSIVYNNYIYSGGSYNCSVNWKQEILWRAPEGGNPGGVQHLPLLYSINNTIVSTNGQVINSSPEGAYNPRESNNIIASFGQNGAEPSNYIGFWNSSYNTTEYKQVDSNKTNLAYMSWGGVGFGNNRWRGAGGSPSGTPSSWSDYVNNYGGTGVNADPDFANNFRITGLDSEPYVLNSTSPAIDVGTDMSYVLNQFEYLPMFDASTDILGNERDANWDIGAFEYQTGAVDTAGNISFTPVTSAELNTEYIAKSYISVDTLCHVWTTTSASFKINYNGTYSTAMKEADPDNGADTVYVKNLSSGLNSTLTTETIVAGGSSANFNVTTKSSTPSGEATLVKSNDGKIIRSSTGKIIKVRR